MWMLGLKGVFLLKAHLLPLHAKLWMLVDKLVL